MSKTCGNCSHWLRLGMLERMADIRRNAEGEIMSFVEVRDCSAIGGRGGQQRADAVGCECFKQRKEAIHEDVQGVRR